MTSRNTVRIGLLATVVLGLVAASVRSGSPNPGTAGSQAGAQAGVDVGVTLGSAPGSQPGVDSGVGSGVDSGVNIDRGQAIQIDLKTMLEKGLRARRPVEFQYIADVVQRVADGELPESLVRSTFGWARKKRPYPFQFFQRAMQVRARKLGISLPTV